MCLDGGLSVCIQRAWPRAILGDLARQRQLDAYGSFLYETLEPLFKRSMCWSPCKAQAISAFISDSYKLWLGMESAHSCEKPCVAMKTPQSHVCGHQGLEELRGSALTCCTGILWQAAALKRGKGMAVRRGKGGRGSHVQLSCEIWHGCGAASEMQRNHLPWKQNKQFSWGTLPENLAYSREVAKLAFGSL